jgi:hypothetical protein
MAPLSTARAHSARRALIAAAGVASAIVAHVAASGDLSLLPVAPALWAMLIALAAVIGTRRAPFAARGIGVTALLVVASQAAMHVGMVFAPWAFGLQAHHADPLLTPGSGIAHIAAAIVLIALVAWGERLLAAMSRLADALLAPAPRRRLPRMAARIVTPFAVHVPACALTLATPTRGPPVPA